MDDVVSYVIGKKKSGGSPTGTIQITKNGSTNVSSYATANVNVQPNLESKSITISSNTTTLVEPTSGKDGLSSVSITTSVPQPSGKITITENGTNIDVSSYATADVSVSGGGGIQTAKLTLIVKDYLGEIVPEENLNNVNLVFIKNGVWWQTDGAILQFDVIDNETYTINVEAYKEEEEEGEIIERYATGVVYDELVSGDTTVEVQLEAWT